MARFASEAERLRAHRQAFNLAMELGCTPREAEAVLRRRERARLKACGTRAPAMTDAAHEQDDAPAAPANQFERWESRWMMRD